MNMKTMKLWRNILVMTAAMQEFARFKKIK